jgi:hypothetical protein
MKWSDTPVRPSFSSSIVTRKGPLSYIPTQLLKGAWCQNCKPACTSYFAFGTDAYFIRTAYIAGFYYVQLCRLESHLLKESKMHRNSEQRRPKWNLSRHILSFKKTVFCLSNTFPGLLWAAHYDFWTPGSFSGLIGLVCCSNAFFWIVWPFWPKILHFRQSFEKQSI